MATLMGTHKGPPSTFLACLASDTLSQMLVAAASSGEDAPKLGPWRRLKSGRQSHLPQGSIV